jgi:hypothetical protein
MRPGTRRCIFDKATPNQKGVQAQKSKDEGLGSNITTAMQLPTLSLSTTEHVVIKAVWISTTGQLSFVVVASKWRT